MLSVTSKLQWRLGPLRFSSLGYPRSEAYPSVLTIILTQDDMFCLRGGPSAVPADVANPYYQGHHPSPPRCGEVAPPKGREMTYAPRTTPFFCVFLLLFFLHAPTFALFNNRKVSRFCKFRRSPALADPSSRDYAPSSVLCPQNLLVRVADQYPWPISSGEDKYLSEKAVKSVALWEEYLSRVQLADFNITGFLKNAKQNPPILGETIPNFAFAISGGGTRALLYGASILDAFDQRNEEAVKARVGGVLQLANYVTGLSAGAWLLASWATANFERMSQLNQSVWNLNKQSSYFSWKFIKKLPKYYFEVLKKKKAGFRVSFIDLWGRILSTQFIYDQDDGKRVLFSSITKTSGYQQRLFPFPIITALSRQGHGKRMSLQTPMYEFTPEDFNIWHPSLNASIPIEYIGSEMSFTTGKGLSCVKGFDNAGFLMATSSNVFSYQDGSNMSPTVWEKFINLFIKGSFYEALIPNPFQGRNTGLTPGSGFDDCEKKTLLLADGAMEQENLPLFPLLQPSRKVDAILALDSTVNGYTADNPEVVGYPNGTSLFRTYLKLQAPEFLNYPYPKIPNTYDSSFVAGGYNKRPTFFGCDMDRGPLIVYLPNYFTSDPTDMPTMKAKYTDEEVNGFFRNSFLIATQKNSTLNDVEWPACLACALIDRQRQRQGDLQTTQCERCFKRYCA
ncbi:hypothetical protein O181_027106 [Austropuccinia psidii MF-1]|uniref:Lysophospholipase n=1 Tax=Austropuccinia psidii MF-1 TaxID=1389203 RepID=A0A9Q3H148_9BASI|nr:hypothetical protein [Austropuccinia psidii MF-1]